MLRRRKIRDLARPESSSEVLLSSVSTLLLVPLMLSFSWPKADKARVKTKARASQVFGSIAESVWTRNRTKNMFLFVLLLSKSELLGDSLINLLNDVKFFDGLKQGHSAKLSKNN